MSDDWSNDDTEEVAMRLDNEYSAYSYRIGLAGPVTRLRARAIVTRFWPPLCYTDDVVMGRVNFSELAEHWEADRLEREAFEAQEATT